MIQYKKNYLKILPFLVAGLTIVFSSVFKSYPSITENIYSTMFYPKIALVFSQISVLLPISLDDIFYVGLVVMLVGGLILVFANCLRFKIYLLRILQILALVYASFYWLWGFNYYRQNVYNRLNFKKNDPDTEEFSKVLNAVVDQVNESYSSYSKVSKDGYIFMFENIFQDFQQSLKLNYPCGKRRVKYITFSDFFAKATILGYYGPFFNEVHINKYLSVWDEPVVIAHEMSHQFGITSESEANLYAWMICINCKDEFVRYCGWFYVLNYFLWQSKKLEGRSKILERIRPEVIADIKSRRMYWMKLRNSTIDRAARNVNDAYLKSNNVDKGINDYNDIVQLVVDIYMSPMKKQYFNTLGSIY